MPLVAFWYPSQILPILDPLCPKALSPIFGSILVALVVFLLPNGPPGLEADQLPRRLGAAGGVVLQIAFFGLSLETLFLISEKLEVPVSRLFED